MKLLGFNFDKVYAEKLSSKAENLSVNSKIDIPEIVQAKADFFNTPEEILGIKFVFGLEYAPDFAKIELSGSMLIALDPKIAKEVLKQWKDKKETPEDFRVFLFNIILKKSTLKALQLEEELNIPLHMQLPSLKKQEKS